MIPVNQITITFAILSKSILPDTESIQGRLLVLQEVFTLDNSSAFIEVRHTALNNTEHIFVTNTHLQLAQYADLLRHTLCQYWLLGSPDQKNVY